MKKTIMLVITLGSEVRTHTINFYISLKFATNMPNRFYLVTRIFFSFFRMPKICGHNRMDHVSRICVKKLLQHSKLFIWSRCNSLHLCLFFYLNGNEQKEMFPLTYYTSWKCIVNVKRSM